jgi:hypothetical protein
MLSTFLAGAPPAQARTTWYWTDTLASNRIEAHYNYAGVDCTGYGRWTKARGQRLYQRFDCFGYDTETFESVELYLRVKGSWDFALVTR